MKYIIECEIEGSEFLVTIPDLNFTSSYGVDKEEALNNIKEAALLYVEGVEELPSTGFISSKDKDMLYTIEIEESIDDFKVIQISKV